MCKLHSLVAETATCPQEFWPIYQKFFHLPLFRITYSSPLLIGGVHCGFIKSVCCFIHNYMHLLHDLLLRTTFHFIYHSKLQQTKYTKNNGTPVTPCLSFPPVSQKNAPHTHAFMALHLFVHY